MSAMRLNDIEEREFRELIPEVAIRDVIGCMTNAGVKYDRTSIQAWNLSFYNTCLFVDLHYKYAHLPKDTNHPLMGMFDVLHDDELFLEHIGGDHNQVLVIDESITTSFTLHLAGIYGDTLLLNYIELVNPTRRASRPFDIEQEYEGIGHGVFKVILDNITALARKNGFECIKCHATDMPRAELFIRKGGFKIDESDELLYNAAMMNHIQIPLVLDI